MSLTFLLFCVCSLTLAGQIENQETDTGIHVVKTIMQILYPVLVIIGRGIGIYLYWLRAKLHVYTNQGTSLTTGHTSWQTNDYTDR